METQFFANRAAETGLEVDYNQPVSEGDAIGLSNSEDSVLVQYVDGSYYVLDGTGWEKSAADEAQAWEIAADRLGLSAD